MSILSQTVDWVVSGTGISRLDERGWVWMKTTSKTGEHSGRGRRLGNYQWNQRRAVGIT